MVKHLEKDENLLDIVGNELCLVDFYADWCGPCKMLAPILEKIDFIPIVKVNVDEHEATAKEYGIMSIPTMIIFKDGKEIKKEIGFRTLEEIKEMVNNI